MPVRKTFGLHPLVAGITTCPPVNLCPPRLLSFSADLLLPNLYFLENQKQFPDQVSLSLEPDFTGICPSVSTGKSPSSKGRFPKAHCPLLPSSPLLFAPSHQQASILQPPSLKGGVFSIPSRSQPFHYHS